MFKRLILCFTFVVFLLPACAQMNGNIGQPLVSPSPVLDRIIAKGELVVGVAPDLPPFIMKERTGKLIGLDADLAQNMANALGVRLRYETMVFADLLPALEAGKIDMALSCLTMSPKRNIKVAFVGPYFVSGQTFLTKKKTLAAVRNASEINSPDTILVAVAGSTSQKLAEKALPKAKLVLTATLDEAVKAVRQDKAHALIADYPFCILSALRFPGEGLTTSINPLTYEPIGVALPKSDPLLMNWVGNFLSLLQGAGEMDQLRKGWIENGSWLATYF